MTTLEPVTYRLPVNTKQKRLIGALFLAITAPTEAKSAACVAIAESLAVGMTTKQIEICKGAAAQSAKAAKGGAS